ncbi:MAG: tryptophan synthase subunit alpha [Lachnospiraceae bacterium]|nr:tryptophan synthase subunit alpha [Lachnospiraceae bacterium]
MNRIKEAFNGKKAVIGFITAGDPGLDRTEEFILEMERAGASLIELGIPFSDPVAEGPDIQSANVRALSAGCTTDKVFAMVGNLRTKTQIPLVFFAYANTLYKYGYEKFCKRCNETGVDGFIIPDLPYEEKDELSGIAESNGVTLIPVISSVSVQRIQMIAKEADGFIYIIPPVGTADTGNTDMTGIQASVNTIREFTSVPVAVNYDMDNREQALKYINEADGVITGSAIVKIVEEYGYKAGEHIYNYIYNITKAAGIQ